MEKLKEWAMKHKALAIGGGIALVVLLYLWLRSGSSSNAGANSSNAALASYYGAEASSLQSASQQVVAQDQLQAAENQTNVAGQVATAQIAAQKAPYQTQLDELTTLANLKAYQDFLAESGGSTATTTSAATPTLAKIGYGTGPGGTADQYVYGYPGQQGTLLNVNWPALGGPSGETLTAAEMQGGPVTNLESIPGVTWAGLAQTPGSAPAPVTTTTPQPPPIQPGQFNGFAMPTV